MTEGESTTGLTEATTKTPGKRAPAKAGVGNTLLLLIPAVILTVSATALVVIYMEDPANFLTTPPPVDESDTTGDDAGGNGDSGTDGGGGIVITPPPTPPPDNNSTEGENTTVIDPPPIDPPPVVGTPCDTWRDCPGPDRPWDFCSLNYECRELTKVCSTEVLIDPCGVAATGSVQLCDEASRTCYTEFASAELTVPLESVVPGPEFGQTLAEMATIDQSGGMFEEDDMVEFYSDPGINLWEYTFNATGLDDLTRMYLLFNYRHSSSAPSSAQGIWTAYNWTEAAYSTVLTSTQDFYGATQWYLREVAFPGVEHWVQPGTGLVKVQFSWDSDKAHRYDYMALKLESCPECDSQCDVTGCGLNERCDVYTGNCICAPGWGGANCTTRAVAPPIVDNTTVYDQDNSLAVYPVQFEVLENLTLAGFSYTWDDVLNDDDRTDAFKPIVPCRFVVANSTEFGDPFGTDWPVGVPNAAVKLRGEFSRTQPYPGMKVEIMDEWIEARDPEAPTRWKTFNRINMLTSTTDSSSLKQSTMYRALRGFPHLNSWRTWFVNLMIVFPDGTPTPWGHATVVEDGRDRMLEEHGLSADADSDNHCLYKLRSFLWAPLEGSSETDPYAVDMVELERRLDPKSCTELSHHKILRAARDFNNFDIPIEDLVAEYVYLPNAMSWLVTGMLMYDTDHVGKNAYLLTTPDKGNVVYWLPWDFDDIFSQYGSKDYRHATGLAQYVSRYFNVYWWRILRSYPGAIDELIAQAEALHADHLSEANLRSIFYEGADAVIDYYVNDPYAPPFDLADLHANIESRLALVNSTYDSVMLQLDSPVAPKELDAVDYGGGEWGFEWVEGFSPHNRSVYYDLVVSTDPDFNSWVHRDTSVTNVTPSWVEALPADLSLGYTITLTEGVQYYARLEIVDSTGRRAQSARIYECSPGGTPGDVCFTG